MEDFLTEVKLLITGENLYFNDFAQQNLPILFSLIKFLPRSLFPRLIERTEAELHYKMRQSGKNNVREKLGNERFRKERHDRHAPKGGERNYRREHAAKKR